MTTLSDQELEQLRYPIGRFKRPETVTAEDLERHIATLEALPQQIRDTVAGWSDTQLDTPYRPGGWTVRQLIHHIADSHMNAYIRIKLALTEEVPTIKAYEENEWAGLSDGKEAPVEWSLELLKYLHLRWTKLLRSLSAEQLEREFLHPAYTRAFRVDGILALYDWHSRHHLAHIQGLQFSPPAPEGGV